jgi:hypothetical protein
MSQVLPAQVASLGLVGKWIVAQCSDGTCWYQDTTVAPVWNEFGATPANVTVPTTTPPSNPFV